MDIDDAAPAAPDAARALAAALAALAIGAALSACSRQGGPPAPSAAGGAPPALSVSVVNVATRKVPVQVEVVGILEAVREVEVRARVGGVLQQQNFREGEMVRADALLYTIDRAPFEIALDATRANLAQAEARVEQARRENERNQALVAQQMVSQRAADEAASALKTALAQQDLARVQVRDAQLNLDYTRVTAPIAGIAQRSLRSVGNLVNPGNDTASLTTLVQTNPIRVRFSLSESEAALLRSGHGRKVQLLGPDGRSIGANAKLDFTGSVVDARLGTVEMRAELPNASGALLPGQFVRARLTTGERDGVVLPQAAVMSGEQGRFVWVVGADNTAQPRPVQTGPWQGTDWVIHGGLTGGEHVIVDNLIKLRPGAPVAPKPAGAASAQGGVMPAGSAPQPGASAAPGKPAATAPRANPKPVASASN